MRQINANCEPPYFLGVYADKAHILASKFMKFSSPLDHSFLVLLKVDLWNLISSDKK